MDAERQLAWEARHRPRAAAGAVVGGLLPILGLVLGLVALNPVNKQLRGLDSDRDEGRIKAIGLRGTNDHATALLLSRILLVLGAIGVAVALYFLLRAAVARGRSLPKALLYLPVGAAVLFALGQLAGHVLQVGQAHDFVSSPDQSPARAQRIAQPGALPAQVAFGLGQLGLALSFVLAGINGMQVGLLTRFMGILAVIVGTLTILPIFPLPVVQALWLFAFAALLLGRWPRGVPPAWRTGQAEPWPTQQELREAREREEGLAPTPEPAAAGAGAHAADGAAGAARRRKRKRR